MPQIKGVRKVQAPGRTHEHIAGVCTVEGVYFSREDVAASIDTGVVWWSEGDGERAVIRKAPLCPFPGCSTIPYLTTRPDHTPATDIENLPPC